MSSPAEFVVFSGFNNRAVVAFCRAATACRIPFSIIARCGDDPILRTSYADRVVVRRESDVLDTRLIREAMSAVRAGKNGGRFVYTPTTEYLNRFIIANRSACEEAGLHVDLVDKDLYEKVSDKECFYRICKENGLDVPEQTSDIRKAIIPFVAKPRRYFGAGGRVSPKPFLLQSPQSVDEFMAEHEAAEFVYQDLIDGKSFYLMFYFCADGSAAAFSQENLVQQHDGGSMVAAWAADLHRQPISASYEALFRKLGFRGFVMVELRERSGEWFMIEANPRLWGPIQLTLDAGAGLFAAFFRDHGHFCREPAPAGDDTVKYFWCGGMAETARLGRTCAFHSFTPARLVDSFDQWLRNDVWLRPDSHEVFSREAGHK